MSRKRVSSIDLSWRFFEVLRDEDHIFQRGLSVAVVPDTKLGWRAILAGRGKRHMSNRAQQRFIAIERDLQRRFALKADL